jgi:hypothetical protein
VESLSRPPFKLLNALVFDRRGWFGLEPVSFKILILRLRKFVHGKTANFYEGTNWQRTRPTWARPLTMFLQGLRGPSVGVAVVALFFLKEPV